MPGKDFNSAKSNTSTAVNTGEGNGLEGKISKLNGVKKAKTAGSDVNGSVNGNKLLKLNQNNPLAPKPGYQKMLFNRLVNARAIPGVSPRIGMGGGGGSANIPAFTSAVELVTQAGDVLTTQAGVDLVTQ